ncbi:MAG: hypothetical protein A3B99_03185 [Candidatus Yanofskybacteria bacterium RIFCSPHIGHO2_02_FULL_44_12b]|uniref:Uncharacterized protein n=2 Tax=Candidatus Yanofskyibacteriota TaxID=1752733 RepID=A0A1F8GMA9_9BACT|nr:MAG: hypothetical protein UW79_C0005G0005 [Candidatus Yanofskybacteria bacterium GW2011_GWA2_44_9]OGN05525.1 MAG: hypothetical protein A2659_02960 [Candidatus Yanofskybacteria bacterium RIFCSPHIGHO2_01_FULL_44_24]OGN15075.1 MAG: hypothetical protein A3B99_03185 [Candidatus Yanofskybacteria bacterium RIFCSPHIGHO2_02_FULL_44_12b]OGN26544.1 MAG: hypothetical protein A2925_03325 [Candidatus Yanofskybacteria bacterium RIFCSPLOWO2_01_FULL_44_22]
MILGPTRKVDPDSLTTEEREDFERFWDIIHRILLKKMDNAYRNAWEIILDGATAEEKQELSEIIEEFGKQGLVIVPKPLIEIDVVKLEPPTIH